VPAVLIKYILQQIQTYYGITFTGDFMAENTWVPRLFILTNTAEDGSTTANLKIAVGDLKVAEFVNAVRLTFGLSGDVSLINKAINFDFSNNYFNAEVTADWSKLCSNIISKTSSPYNGLQIEYDIDEDDKTPNNTVFNKLYTTSGAMKPKVIKSPFSIIGYGTGSKFTQAGRTSVNGQFNTKNKPRIGLFFGLFDYGLGIKPFLKYDYAIDLRNTANSITRDKKFAAEETFWKNTFEATFKINLRKLSLSSFDIKSKVHIHGWNYLIKRIVLDCNNPENSLLEAYRA
jgi:hypothetical protein